MRLTRLERQAEGTCMPLAMRTTQLCTVMNVTTSSTNLISLVGNQGRLSVFGQRWLLPDLQHRPMTTRMFVVFPTDRALRMVEKRVDSCQIHSYLSDRTSGNRMRVLSPACTPTCLPRSVALIPCNTRTLFAYIVDLRLSWKSEFTQDNHIACWVP